MDMVAGTRIDEGGAHLPMTDGRLVEMDARLSLSSELVTTLTTADPEGALRAIGDNYAPSYLDIYGDSNAFELQIRSVRMPGLDHGTVRFGTDVRVTALPPSCYVICIANSGSLEVMSGRTLERIGGSSAAIIFPHERTLFQKWNDDASLVTLRIDEETLEKTINQLLGHQISAPVHFQSALDLASPSTRSLDHILSLVRMEADNLGLLIQDQRGASLITEMLITALLLSQPNNYSEILHQPALSTAPEHIRIARDIIEADPMSIGSIGELADSVHISVRTLEQGFRRHLDTSPHAYLRGVRLQRARQDLLAGDPAEHTVAQVAYRWGFHHLGRFAQTYRSRFGELPAATLRSKR